MKGKTVMADKVEKQISLIFDTLKEDSSSELISHVIKRTLRNSYGYDTGEGIIYYATDYEETPDFDKRPPADLIMLENISEEASKEKVLNIIENVSNGARLFIPLDLQRSMKLSGNNVFTYSITSQEANWCLNKLTEIPEGGWLADLVYQADPSGKKSFKDRFFPSYNKNMFVRLKVNSLERKDILNVLKAFAFCTALSIESKYISEEISGYVFGSMRRRASSDGPAPSHRNISRREKEFIEE